MNATLIVSRPWTLARATLAGIALIAGLLLYCAVAYPGSVAGGGMSRLSAVIVGLIAYGGAAVWAMRQSAPLVRAALGQGAKLGALLAMGAWANMALEHFASMGAAGSLARGVGMWALMFVTFGAAGSTAYRQSKSLSIAVVASVWSAIVSTVAALVFGFALAVMFMPHMLHILAGPIAESGMTDPRSYVVRNTLESASNHLLLAPVVAALFGLTGGIAHSLLRTIRRSLVIVIGGVEIGLLVAGISALRIASSLARAERPPLVMTGLLSVGIAMACAHAVLSAIRRPETPQQR